jgi:prophage regulatory protein
VSTHKKPTRKTIIRLTEVKRRTGKSRAAIYVGMSCNKFPTSISLGARAVGWIEEEIDDWIEDRIEKSRGEEYSPANKMPKKIRERYSNGTVLTQAAKPQARAAHNAASGLR